MTNYSLPGIANILAVSYTHLKMVEKQAVEASMINLKEYRAKRQFGKTPEPMADTVETPNRMPVRCV